MYTRPLCCMSLTGLYVDVHACVSIGTISPARLPGSKYMYKGQSW